MVGKGSGRIGRDNPMMAGEQSLAQRGDLRSTPSSLAGLLDVVRLHCGNLALVRNS
jgi:hypothetical protein